MGVARILLRGKPFGSRHCGASGGGGATRTPRIFENFQQILNKIAKNA